MVKTFWTALCAGFLFLSLGVSLSPAAIVTVTDKTGVQVPAYMASCGCGPLAAASILGYWDMYGYEALFSASGWGDVKDTANIASELSILWGLFDPDGDKWSYVTDAPHTFETYAQDHGGYVFQASNENFTRFQYSFKGEIDSGRPVMFLVDWNGDGATDHFVPVFGYDDRGDEGLYYGFYTNWSENETPQWEEFASMQYGEGWGVGMATILLPLSSPDPVPLPAPLLLLTSGLLLLMGFRRKAR